MRNRNMYFTLFMPTLDVILPVFDPPEGWEQTVIQRFHSLQAAMKDFSFQLLIVNDGSTKLDEIKSRAIIEQNIRDGAWISYPNNVGKGHALRCGVRESSGDFILYTDVDWPYTEESMKEVLQKLLHGEQAVIGVRDEDYYAHLSGMRRVISQLLQKINGMLLNLQVNDTQAGLKGFRKELKEVFLSTTIERYLFDLEFVYLLSKKHIKIATVPVQLRTGITFSKVNRKVLLQEAKNFLRILMKKGFRKSE